MQLFYKNNYMIKNDLKKSSNSSFKGSLISIINDLVKEMGLKTEQALELVGSYVNVLPDWVNVLYMSLEASDYEKALSLLNKLKSTSENLRMKYLLSILNRLEKRLYNTDYTQFSSNIQVINKYIECLKIEIEQI